jgi:hypothetical protein
MSSTYSLVCVSHNPATWDSDHHSDDAAAAAQRSTLDTHPRCDLLIARVSGGLVEVGCPPTRDQRGGHPCRTHTGIEWARVELLRLLAAAHLSDDAAVRKLAAQFPCWSWERLRTLAADLGLPVGGER